MTNEVAQTIAVHLDAILGEDDDFQEEISRLNEVDGAGAAVKFIFETLHTVASMMAEELLEAIEDDDEDTDPA